MDFLKSKFDNLLLFILIMLMLIVLLHVTHDKGDDALVAWLEQALTTVLGAFIGLTQASRVAFSKSQTGGNGNDKTSTGSTVVTPGIIR